MIVTIKSTKPGTGACLNLGILPSGGPSGPVSKETAMTPSLKKPLRSLYNMRYMYLMFLPVLLYFILFHYVPMYGITLAFKDFKINEGILGSPWVGLANFRAVFAGNDFYNVMGNTLVISVLKIVCGFPFPILFALLLNEISSKRYKSLVQTVSYLPYLMSWVILGAIVLELLSPSRGVFNYIITLFGGDPVYFVTRPDHFRGILVISSVWQSVGWNSVIYLAAIAGIDAEQYESAYIDGAGRYQLARYITLPSILPTVAVMFILSLGGILNAGFDQVFNLYNPSVYNVSDIVDTYVYRMGLANFQYSISTAVNVFKNVIGFALTLASNFIIRAMSRGEYGIW